MAEIQKLSDTSYKIVLGGGDISRAFPENFSQESIEGTPSGKVIDGTVAVEITPDVADIIRDKVSRELTLGLQFGDLMAENKFLHALFSSPMPFSGLFGELSPALNVEDIAAIEQSLKTIPRTFECSMGGSIGVGDRYRLKFIPDARGFDIRLENIDVLDDLTESHSFAVSVPFTISSLDIDNPIVSDGTPSAGYSSSIDDAKVMFYEKDFPINGGELLTRAMALSQVDRGMWMDAYISLFGLSFWRGASGISVEELGSRPFASHLCGVDPSGNAIQYLPIDGLEGRIQEGSSNLLLSGFAKVQFLVGEIRYPFNPIFGLRKTLFDICIDDPAWSDVGPLALQYIGGDGVEGVEVIHSWTGRKSSSPKSEMLSAIGQTKLGG